MIKCIAAVDKNFGIGYKNKLLFSIPEDMKFFKETTKDSVVVMGRNTYDSIGKPLKDRVNIVITSKLDLRNNKEVFSGSLEEMERIINLYSDQDIYIIGGSSIYNYFIDKCDAIWLTMYDREYQNVDSYFPDIIKHGFIENSKIKDGYFEDHYYKITYWTKKLKIKMKNKI